VAKCGPRARSGMVPPFSLPFSETNLLYEAVA
jgi:hypothetical protein